MLLTDEIKNDFSRFETALHGGVPDKIPLAELDVGKSIKEEFIGREINSIKDEVEFWQKAGYDFVPLKLPLEFKLDDNEEKSSDNQQALSISENSCMIKDWQDFNAYPWPDAEKIDFNFLDEAAEAMPDSMKSVILCGGFLSRPMLLMGYEEFCYALVDKPDLIEALFDRVGQAIYKAFEIAVQKPKVGAIWISNDMGYTEGLLVSVQTLRQYVFPWFEKIKSLCTAYDIPLILHSDGKLDSVIEDFIRIGVDAIHPIEPEAMDIFEVKKKYGDRICLMGNIDVDLLYRGKPEEIAAEVKKRIAFFSKTGGYCIGSGNSVPDGVPLENYLALIQAAR